MPAVLGLSGVKVETSTAPSVEPPCESLLFAFVSLPVCECALSWAETATSELALATAFATAAAASLFAWILGPLGAFEESPEPPPLCELPPDVSPPDVSPPEFFELELLPWDLLPPELLAPQVLGPSVPPAEPLLSELDFVV